MVDFHSHIIYDIDDGSDNIEMSMSMLENSKNNGITTICATSHFTCGVYEPDKFIYFNKLKELNKISPIQIIPSLEIRLDDNLISNYTQGRVWGINNGSYMLIELPFTHIPKNTNDILYELRLKGIKPILAHPERYYEVIKNPKIVESLICNGILMQINGDSLLGFNGRKIQKVAKHLVKHNMAHLLGSDAHNLTTRTTDLSAAFKLVKKINPTLYSWMLENQHKIIQSEKVTFPQIIEKGGWFL